VHRLGNLPLFIGTLLSSATVVLPGCSEPTARQVVADHRPVEAQSLELSSLLSGEAEGFARATETRQFDFPADHGPHPDFRTEWWYLTGNVETASRRRFGYQLTLFRNAVAAAESQRESAWATRQVYMGHLALTDVDGDRFHAFERFARGAAGLAGAELEPFRVWLEDWELSGPSSPPPFRLSAAADDIELDFELGASKPLVLQGQAGLSRKGRQPGNASYYYAFTRLQTTGVLHIGGVELEVQGTSWLDREWSTSVLEPGQRGWDWFALQLDDGTDLMVYQLRRDDGSPDPLSSGSQVDAHGDRIALSSDDFQLEVLDWWTSPASGTSYPSGWRLTLANEGLELRIEPLLQDQELRLSVLYWEGAVEVRGTRNRAPVAGRGYVELTGYHDQ
jgi:predicted secreted hydrolase